MADNGIGSAFALNRKALCPLEARGVQTMKPIQPSAVSHDEARQPWSWRSWILSLMMIAALIGAVLHWSEVENFARIAASARPEWLALALLLQLSTYASVAAGWAMVLSRAGHPQPLKKLMGIAVTKLFADQAFPSAGLGGNILLVDQLRQLGVPRGSAVATLLISMIGYYAAFASFALITLVLLWLHYKATPLVAGMVTLFLLVAVAIPSLALWLRRRGSEPLPKSIEHIAIIRSLLEAVADAPSHLMKDLVLLAKVAGFNGLIFLIDAATLLMCLHALGETPAFSTAIIALILALIVVTLGPVPLGLGSFEASTTATLHHLGIPIATAFTATMLFRILVMWLPMIPGLVLMRHSIKRSRTSQSR
jgi:glycosyltransferase 2 family protein